MFLAVTQGNTKNPFILSLSKDGVTMKLLQVEILPLGASPPFEGEG